MSTFKDRTIADSYDTIVKRTETYAQAGTQIMLMTDTNATEVATGLYLEGGGDANVGIGIASPLSRFHSIGTARFENVATAADTLGAYMTMTTNSGTSSDGTFRFEDRLAPQNNPSFVWNVASLVNSGGVGTVNAYKFQTGDNNRLVIQQDGYVGINTSSPDYMFQVSAGNNEVAAGFYSGDDCVKIVLEDNNTSHDMSIGHSSTNNCAFIGYGGGTGTEIDNLNINRDGHVGIGCIPNATFPLDVRGNAANYMLFVANAHSGADGYGIKVQCGANDGAGTTYYLSADDGDGDPKGLDTINGLKIRDFKFKKSGDSYTAGIIANELKTVFPSAVYGEEDAMEDILDDDGKKIGERISPMTISRPKLIPVLVKAVQELSAKVTALEAKDTATDTAMAALTARVVTLESA